MTGTRPRVYSIAPGIPFVDALAQGLIARLAAEVPRDPLALARATVLLPTRRAVRALREAFLRATDGTPLLLPRMMPLGDLDEDELFLADEPGSGSTPGDGADLPPVIGGMRRQMLLARLVLRFGDARWREADPAQAVELAAELARLLDHMETEGVAFDRLVALRPEDENLARHWDEILEFLKILTRHWPGVLAEEGAIGPADRRNLLLVAQAEQWRATPPDGWVIAAGSTGSIPATADLLDAVAGLERGCVVLPGLDVDMDDEDWAALEKIDTHAQAGLARLLTHLGVARTDVRPWGADWPSAGAGVGHPDRTRLLAVALSPRPQQAPAEARLALEGVSWIESPAPAEEAAAIALIMRETLEHDHRTAALITPDRGLARRVAARLNRWGIGVDDSAGMPLAATPVAAFLRLVAEMVASGFEAVSVLACLKHPLASGGMARETFRARVRDLDRLVLRGPSGAPGLRSLRARIEAKAREYAARDKADLAARTRALIPWLERVEALAALLAEALARGPRPCDDLARAHVAVAEALAADDATPGADRLWRGEEAEAVAGFFADLTDAADGFPAVSGARYPELLAALLTGRVVRPRFGRHPRLNIWGPLEARLQHADVVILGGLNEGTWPPDPGMDPWMSRPMREKIGLSLPERRIGLAAHDFAQAFAAPRVVLSRSQRVGGQPTVPSRWLLRLANTLGDDLVAKLKASGAYWLARAARLDRDRGAAAPQRPLPCPALHLRPRRLSVTEIPTLQVNPYGIYARHVLHLDPLESIAADPGAAERGNFVHDVMERFFKRFPSSIPAGGAEEFRIALEEIGRECLAPVGIAPGLHAIWWPRFRDIARWVATQEVARRTVTRPLAAEIPGRLRIEAPGGAFFLTGRADRIDRLADGRLAVVDYKTGVLPAPADDKAGFAPQLPLLAAMAEAGAFDGLRPMAVGDLAYWKLSGGEEGGMEKSFARDDGVTVEDAVRAALDGLIGLIGTFDDEKTPYAPYVYPARVRFDRFEHLARVSEWSGDAGAGAEDEA
jgi:ATP-dependent helicase/nuclease subunit B